ncbi:MAG: DUF4126 domain-containing protein [Actinomycetota bacterium]|nr:DUF4126 domain-containing protein [Actinomycetota bacterium]HZY64358.1 DUF4126 domain-containing protein [Rubrobacteraceae bacterium]
METLLAAGTGAGLSSVAGLRAYLPLALVGLFARIGLFDLPAPFDFLDNWVVVVTLLILALVEGVLDKIPALDTAVDVVQTPVRIVAGAVLFSAALEAGLDPAAIPELAAGGGIAGVVAVLKAVLRPPANVSTAGVSAPFLSGVEDVVALVGGIIAILVPLISLLLVAFLLFVFYRIRKRRGRKYGGLRILGD